MTSRKVKDNAINNYNNVKKLYDQACEKLAKKISALYNLRRRSVSTIEYVEKIINSIANTPKSFSRNVSSITPQVKAFQDKEYYARKSMEDTVKTGKGMAAGVIAGTGIAVAGPSVLMGIATTFGTASTGTAISSLSGVAAKKAAQAWIGRTLAGFLVKEGAGLAVGTRILTAASPIGWILTGVSVGKAVVKNRNRNLETAGEINEERDKVATAKGKVNILIEKIEALIIKTDTLHEDLNNDLVKISRYTNADYETLSDEDKMFLGKTVNLTMSLSELLNESVA